MRKNVALGTYNRATYLDQKQAIMKEKRSQKFLARAIARPSWKGLVLGSGRPSTFLRIHIVVALLF